MYLNVYNEIGLLWLNNEKSDIILIRGIVRQFPHHQLH